jgi:hypothetical protein
MNGRHLARLAATSLATLAIGATWATAIRAAPTDGLALGQGQRGAYAWSVRAEVHRTAGRDEASPPSQPCLVVTALLRQSRFSFRRTRYRDCLEAGENLVANSSPLLGAAPLVVAGARYRLTALGIIAAPSVRRVHFDLCSGRGLTIALQRPDSAAVTGTALPRLRYAAFAFHGTWCIRGMRTVARGGRLLWESGDESP